MQWPALYRFKEYAPIEKTYYDIEKKEIKGLRFPAVYGPAKDFIVTHEHLLPERYEPMYERFSKHAKLIAVAFVNSMYYMYMYTDRVEGSDVDGEDSEVIPGFYDYSSMQNRTYIPVGFEKTFCPVVSSLITPSRIFYDPEINKIYYKGSWIDFDKGTPAEFKSKSLYKELLLTKSKNGVVYTDSGDHIYLR